MFPCFCGLVWFACRCLCCVNLLKKERQELSEQAVKKPIVFVFCAIVPPFNLSSSSSLLSLLLLILFWLAIYLSLLPSLPLAYCDKYVSVVPIHICVYVQRDSKRKYHYYASLSLSPPFSLLLYARTHTHTHFLFSQFHLFFSSFFPPHRTLFSRPFEGNIAVSAKERANRVD